MSQLSFLQSEFAPVYEPALKAALIDPRGLYESPFTDLDDQGISGVFPAADVKVLIQPLNDVRGRTAV